MLHPDRADLIPDAIGYNFVLPGESKRWRILDESMLELARQRGIPEVLLQELRKVEDPDLKAERRERSAALTEPQRKVITEFVALFDPEP